jgi:glycosyltransferase 2 family protein
MKLRIAKIAFFMLGALFLALLVKRIGISVLVADIRAIGWGFIGLLALAASWEFFNTLGWRIVLDHRPHEIPFWRLYIARQVGEAFNITTPLANVGGEPVKAYLLKGVSDMPDVAASLILDKTIKFLVNLTFIILGSLLAFALLPLPLSLKVATSVLLALAGTGLTYFYVLQRRGLLAGLTRLAGRLHIRVKETTLHKIEEIDRTVELFYHTRKRRFIAACAVTMASRLVSTAEIVIVGQWIGADVSYLTALFIASLVAIVNAAFFFIPAQLGIMEGTQAFLFHLLGLGVQDGLALGVVRRIRVLLWIGGCFAIFYGREIFLFLRQRARAGRRPGGRPGSLQGDDLGGAGL